VKKEMELWDEASEYLDRAIETKDRDKAIELYDKAIALWLQAAKQAETEKIRLIVIGNARMAEAEKYSARANKLISKANESYGSEQVGCLRE